MWLLLVLPVLRAAVLEFLFFLAVSLVLFLFVLHFDENRNKAVLHFFLKLQLVSQGPAAAPALRVLLDGRLNFLQQLILTQMPTAFSPL